ncbi:hypothetical protein O6H91_22G028600 [Diphasiastrum complanatum]|uniref:Uncharacterized protein n=1 Tax=Diphasiastrum complanatum TaxID=34168 RepID=A0ACC2AE08_DIPCM|nr:hypothetical protein O6H91_22G028600 [Diphasiastrum complanatum]
MANKRKPSKHQRRSCTTKLQKGSLHASKLDKEPEHVNNIDKESDRDEEFSLATDLSSNVYNALLLSLQASGGSFAKAYAQRQREEQGDSSDESGEEEGCEEERQNNFGELQGSHGNYEELNKHEANSANEFVVKEIVQNEISICSDNDESRHANSNNELMPVEEQEEIQMEETDSYSRADLCSGNFKHHMEHIVTEEERKKLAQITKFRSGAVATGIQGAKWLTSAVDFPKVDKRLEAYGMKLRIGNHWKSIQAAAEYGDFASEQQCQFFAMCNSYQDIIHSRRPILDGTIKGEEEDRSIMDAYLLHLLNHVLKTRDLVTKNNEKLQHHINTGLASKEDMELPRDQGFTRPKVLILMPLRSTVLRLVKRLLEVAPPSQKVSVEHKDRFFDDFGAEESADEEMLNNVHANDKEKVRKGAKPADFRALFGGNNDDHFRLGIKFTRKSIKLYNDLYTSDIIIASPIGLITRISEAENVKDKDIDFLSSIEIVVMDYANVILMQNWSHVVTAFEQLNQIPAQQHGTNFMRIREWYLNGHGRYYRQTIILSPFADAGMNALFLRTCVNHAGKIKLRSEYHGVLSKVMLQVRQVYERIECSSIAEVDDSRFDFFAKQVFTRIKDSVKGGIMVFMRSYFDFVRLRNFLKAQNSSFCLLGEYTKQSDISRARAWFFHGKRKILLYTERAHFYHRYQIRGIHDLIFYSLPDHANFYSEIVNMLEGVDNPSCTVLFSQFDKMQLERIVGSSRAEKLLSSKNRTFMFC